MQIRRTLPHEGPADYSIYLPQEPTPLTVTTAAAAFVASTIQSKVTEAIVLKVTGAKELPVRWELFNSFVKIQK